jgi:hypothetical protein
LRILQISSLCNLARHEAGDDCKIQPDENIQKKVCGIENLPVGEPALFHENQREARAGNIVSAAGQSEDGGQATVREQLRRQQVGEDEDQQSDQESV